MQAGEGLISVLMCVSGMYWGCINKRFWPGVKWRKANRCMEDHDHGWMNRRRKKPLIWCFCDTDDCNISIEMLNNTDPSTPPPPTTTTTIATTTSVTTTITPVDDLVIIIVPYCLPRKSGPRRHIVMQDVINADSSILSLVTTLRSHHRRCP